MPAPIPAPVVAPAPAAAPTPPVAPIPAQAPAPVAAPAAAAPPAPPARVFPAAPETPPELQEAWAAVLRQLPEAEAVAIHAVAFPIEVADGTFRVGVRLDLWRSRVRDAVGMVDLAALVPGARRVDVVVILAGSQGATGREIIADAELRRLAAARTAAEGSEVVRRLLDAFDGELEDVVPSALDLPADPSASDEEPGEAAVPVSG